MQMFDNLPWYGYVIFVVAVGSYLYRYFKKGKTFMEAPELEKVKFKRDANSNLNEQQLFSFALDTVTSEYWEVNTNTLTFKKGMRIKNYLEGWGIDTPEGYWGLTEYFMKDGRRWYFDFIYTMMQTEPEENWENLMYQKFGENERAQRYLNLLKTGKAEEILKNNRFITFDSEIEIGVAAYDACVLIGQARMAFTAEIISEREAWKVINFATQLAKENFSSWEAFGKSYILGFTLDIRHEHKAAIKETQHLYKQVLASPLSPWNQIDWPQK